MHSFSESKEQPSVVFPIVSKSQATSEGDVAENSQKYQCQECGKKCKNDKQLDNHKLYHKSLQIISCLQCNEEITRKTLKKHLKNVHGMEIDPEATWVQGNHILTSRDWSIKNLTDFLLNITKMVAYRVKTQARE